MIDRVEVRWPSGLKEVFANLQADRIYKITEGEGAVSLSSAKRDRK